MSIENEKFQAQVQEELAKLESTETEVKAEETQEVTEDVTEREYTTLEQEQMEKGWDPDKEGGVSAAEFKRVGEIIEAKRKASKEAFAKSKEVEELNKRLERLADQNRKIQEVTRNKVMKELEAKRREAVEMGDVDAFERIEAEKRTYESQFEDAEPVKTAQPTKAPEVIAFETKHKDWLTGTDETSEEMRIFLEGEVYKLQKLQQKKGFSDQEAIDMLESRLEKEFPDKLGVADKPKSKVAVSTASKAAGAGTADKWGSVSIDDREVYQQIAAVDPTYTKDMFIKDYILTRKK